MGKKIDLGHPYGRLCTSYLEAPLHWEIPGPNWGFSFDLGFPVVGECAGAKRGFGGNFTSGSYVRRKQRRLNN